MCLSGLFFRALLDFVARVIFARIIVVVGGGRVVVFIVEEWHSLCVPNHYFEVVSVLGGFLSRNAWFGIRALFEAGRQYDIAAAACLFAAICLESFPKKTTALQFSPSWGLTNDICCSSFYLQTRRS